MSSKHIKYILIIGFQFLGRTSWCQNDSIAVKDTVQNQIHISAFIDTYFGFNPQLPQIRPYAVSQDKLNQLAINLAYLDFAIEKKCFKAKVIPAIGTYMYANYASDKGFFKHFVQASVGLKLIHSKNYWLEAGILNSPFTYETAISKDQLIYTRSLGAENAPYFLTGLKLTLPLNAKLTFYPYLINGWQHINRINNSPALATQLEYKTNQQFSFNWNTFIGNENSLLHTNYKTRYFTDLYFNYQPHSKVTLTCDAYFGIQTIIDSSQNTTANWFNFNACFAYQLNKKISFSGRFEDFYDPKQLLIQNKLSNSPFNLNSFSSCFNYNITKWLFIRVENRFFWSNTEAFIDISQLKKRKTNIIFGSLSVFF